MKISRVSINNKKREFLVDTRSGEVYRYPYVKADPLPTPENRIESVFIDKELGCEAITYVLESGEEGSIHVEQVLEYNKDPNYMAKLLTYKLTLEARKGIAASGLSRRQVAKRLKTSVHQLYRFVDPSNTSISIKQLLALLHVICCIVDIVIDRNQSNCFGT